MTKKETDFVRRILERIKNPDNQVQKAIAFINKDLAIYEARKGQLIEQYDYDSRQDW